MSKPIYILEAEFELDLGFKFIKKIEYRFYFESFGEAELHKPIFEDKAIRKFKSDLKINEDDNDFKVEISIKEKHLFDE